MSLSLNLTLLPGRSSDSLVYKISFTCLSLFHRKRHQILLFPLNNSYIISHQSIDWNLVLTLFQHLKHGFKWSIISTNFITLLLCLEASLCLFFHWILSWNDQKLYAVEVFWYQYKQLCTPFSILLPVELLKWKQDQPSLPECYRTKPRFFDVACKAPGIKKSAIFAPSVKF